MFCVNVAVINVAFLFPDSLQFSRLWVAGSEDRVLSLAHCWTASQDKMGLGNEFGNFSIWLYVSFAK